MSRPITCIWHSATNWQDVLATVRSILKHFGRRHAGARSVACMPCWPSPLVMGPGVNPIGDLVLERVKDEFDPTVCRCTLDD